MISKTRAIAGSIGFGLASFIFASPTALGGAIASIDSSGAQAHAWLFYEEIAYYCQFEIYDSFHGFAFAARQGENDNDGGNVTCQEAGWGNYLNFDVEVSGSPGYAACGGIWGWAGQSATELYWDNTGGCPP